MRQILRAIVAMLAVAALAGGGTVRSPTAARTAAAGSGSSGSGGHHEAGDDNGGSPRGGRGSPRRPAARRPGDDAAQPADVYTLAEPQHGNPEGVAFDKRSGFFFVSATGDGSIYRGKLGDTATPVAVFIPGAAGQSATGLKVQRGKLYAAGAGTGTIKVYDVDSGALLATFDTKGGDSSPTFVNDLDVTKRGDVYATDSGAPGDLPPERRGDRRRHAGAQADRPRRRHLDVARDPVQRRAGAFNLNGIVSTSGDERHRGTAGAHELIVVDSDTGQLFRVKVGKDGNAARRIRELDGQGRPVHGRRRPAHRSRPADRRAGLGRRLPQRGGRLHRRCATTAARAARGPAHRRLLPGAVDHRAGA